MHASISSVAVLSLGLILASWANPGRTQSDRDYVFTDQDGHLVIRFVGTGATGLDESQAYEVLNAEFSTMVHDRLHADLVFDDEPADPEWAASMEPQIAEHLSQVGPAFSAVFIECRAASCRVIMEQPGHRSVPEHLRVLGAVQESLQVFIAARRQQLEPVFMITAYDQDSEISHIKAFLQRTAHQGASVPSY